MKDPERLLRRPSSELASALLRAGADEKPSASSVRRALRIAAVGGAVGATLQATTAAAAALSTKSGLAGVAGSAAVSGAAGSAAATLAASAGVASSAAAGVAAATGAATAAGASALSVSGGSIATVTAVAIAKWVGVGALGGVVAATAAHRVVPGVFESPAPAASTRMAAPKAQPAPASAQAPARAGARRSSHEAASVLHDAPSETPELSEPHSPPEAPQALAAAPADTTATSRSPAPSQRSASEPRPAALGQPVLAAEVAFVDRGRAALQRGDGRGALHLLSDYESAFPKHQLMPEVLFLRMEALSQAGDLERSRALARRIVARGATGPQAARAREVLAR